jgi:YD repeat-containing protein
VSTLPADGSLRIDVQSKILVSYDGALDPASVTRAQVRLLSRGIPCASQVTYDDAAHVVTVDPMGLAYDRQYTLSISGVMGANGLPVAAQSSRFSTWVNEVRSSLFSVFGLPTGLTRYDEPDASGHATRELELELGPDELPGTADDVLARYSLMQAQADGSTIKIRYDGPGADGQWFSADDEVSDYAVVDPGPEGQVRAQLSYSDAGADGQWFTDDDTRTESTSSTFADNSALLTTLDLGLERIAGNFQRNVYGDDGTLATSLTSYDPGPDGAWNTADDPIAWTDVYAYDEFGRLADHQRFSGPLTQEARIPDEDLQYTYRADGRVDHVTITGSIDGGETIAYEYDASGNALSIKTMIQGLLFASESYTYDAHDNRLTGAVGDARVSSDLGFDTTQ